MSKSLGFKVTLAAALIAGCSDDGDADLVRVASGIEGIYSVTSYTRNEQTCEPGGASQLGDDKFAVVVLQKFVGQHYLSITSCESAADCREKLADIRAGESYSIEFQFAVDKVGDGDVLAGAGVSTGFGGGGTCTGGEVWTTKLELVGMQLRIEQAITLADDHPDDGDGFCTTDLTRKHAERNDCSQMEVLIADLLEVL
jgi:hypothetical protein